MSREMRIAPALAGLFCLLQAGLSLAGDGSCGAGGCSTGQCAPQKIDCPPPYYHYYEGPPHLKFKKACPRPICDPCHYEHFGYYQPCWAPWPFPEDWSHCPYPTAAHMLPPPKVPPYAPRIGVERERRDDRRPGDVRPGDGGAPDRPMGGISLPGLPDPKPLEGMGRLRIVPAGPAIQPAQALQPDQSAQPGQSAQPIPVTTRRTGAVIRIRSIN